MKKWLIAFLVLSVIDAVLTFLILECFGGSEALGFWFKWLPSNLGQMVYKVILSLFVAAVAYYKQYKKIIIFATLLVGICCLFNLTQILIVTIGGAN